jgi:DNA-binding transcriptional ArsR family regulator
MRLSAYEPDTATHPLRDYEDGAALLRVLSSPVRLAVLDALSEEERCVHELTDRVQLPQAQVSQHLRVLKDAGLVASRRRGREVVYSVADPHAAQIARAALDHRRDAR